MVAKVTGPPSRLIIGRILSSLVFRNESESGGSMFANDDARKFVGKYSSRIYPSWNFPRNGKSGVVEYFGELEIFIRSRMLSI